MSIENENNDLTKVLPIRSQYLIKNGTPLTKTMPTCHGHGLVLCTGLYNYDIVSEEEAREVWKFKGTILDKINKSYNFEKDEILSYFSHENAYNNGEVHTIGYPIDAIKSFSYSVDFVIKHYIESFNTFFKNNQDIQLGIAIDHDTFKGSWLEQMGYIVHARKTKIIRDLQDFGRELLMNTPERIIILVTGKAINEYGLLASSYQKLKISRDFTDRNYPYLKELNDELFFKIIP